MNAMQQNDTMNIIFLYHPKKPLVSKNEEKNLILNFIKIIFSSSIAGSDKERQPVRSSYGNATRKIASSLAEKSTK